MRAYYEAYDDRYRQVHSQRLQWFSKEPSAIVSGVMKEFSIGPSSKILELGCGEGRDAGFLLSRGYDVLATDVSSEAITYCQTLFPQYREKFRVMNCITEELDECFDFIYAVAVIHMLVPDEDRDGFYRAIVRHLKPNGVALIGTMGDGSFERQSDIATAFDLQERVHEETGRTLKIAGTSCRIVSSDSFVGELERNGLAVVKQGVTAVEPDFPSMMYAVVKRREE